MATILARSAGRRILVSTSLAGFLLAAALVASPVRQAAAGFLGMFRVQKLTVVTFDPNYPVERFTKLGQQMGTVTDSGQSERLRMASSLSEASLRVGLDVTQPTALPPGVNADPLIQTLPSRQVRFTFDSNRAENLLKAPGTQALSVPPSLNGAGLLMSVPPAAALTFLYENDGSAQSAVGPVLVVASGRSPVIEPTGGASLDEIRSFLLSTPGLPPETVQQVANIDDWTTTLPIPVPDGRVGWQEVDVNGAKALMLADNQQHLGSAVVWQRGDVFYVVAGQVEPDQVMATAQSLP